MNLLFPRQESRDDYQTIISPLNSPLEWLEFGRLRLFEKGKSYHGQSGDQEIMLVLLEGKGHVEVEGEGEGNRLIAFDLPHRRDVFLDKPTSVYIPPNHRYEVFSHSVAFDAGLFKAPASGSTDPFLIGSDDIEHRSVGVANWRRDVYLVTQKGMPVERLIVGETVTPPGNWSSYPPHKHDVESHDGERPYEEAFFYLVKPQCGYGLQQLYDSPDKESRLNEVYVVRDGDALSIPHGYHPVVAGAGYQLYYLWALAGEGREYGTWSDDPTHAWLRACEPILDEHVR